MIYQTDMEIEKINIALVGFGNIGSYFYKTLEKNKKSIYIKTGKIPFIKYISAKNLNKKSLISLKRSLEYHPLYKFLR